MSQDYKTTEEGFLINLISFLELCEEIVNRIQNLGVNLSNTASMLLLAKSLIGLKSPKSIIQSFISKSYTQWETCVNKEESKLLNNVKMLFSEVPESQLNNILEVFNIKDSKGNYYVTSEEKDDIWDFLIVFVKLSILHIHEQRKWGILPNGKQGYTVIYEKGISVKTYANMFNVTINN